MHLTIIHDSQGNILSIAASPTGGPTMYVQPQQGHFMTEVDAPDIQAGSDMQVVRQGLASLIANNRVDIERPKDKLRKK